MDYAAARKIMVDSQVRVNDVTDRAIQGAMLAVARERFLPDDRAFSAYVEIEPVIAGGRRLMLARDLSKLLMALDARAGETALAIAAPYAAAVLSRMGLQVTAQEADQGVFDVAGAVLAEEGVKPAVQSFDQAVGGDFDVIVCEAAVPGRPQAWIDALAVGGRLAVVERKGPAGKAVLYIKGLQSVSRRELFDAAPPLLADMATAPAFAL